MNKYSKDTLDRRLSNEDIIERFRLLEDMGSPFSVNNVMSALEETRDLAFETIRLNREFSLTDRNCQPFTPFHGTPLRAKCETQDLVKKGTIVQSFSVHEFVIDIPQFPRMEVNTLGNVF